MPTAITLPPPARAEFNIRAVGPGTSNGSGAGGSPASADDTPACSVSGTIPMPADTSAVTNSAVKGRAALGISALPGRRANTVW